tara:strand:+ start:1585 stop:2037 length:453 start_codon:yes stop_codon:yes gene_type:complete
MKKIILIVGILLISSCGYTPIYSSKESNYKIVNFKKNINNSLTNYIQNSINVLSNENADKVLNIDLELKEEIVVILKDSKGDPAKNRLIITVNLSVLNESENLIASKIFSENFEYNIDDNKFNLKQYERNIKINLVEEITQQVLVYLANV